MHTYVKHKGPFKPYCHDCKRTEDILHLFLNCEKIKKIWRHYKPIYQRLLPNQTLDTTKILLSITTPTDDKNKQKLTQTLTIRILYNIWKNRNEILNNGILQNLSRER